MKFSIKKLILPMIMLLCAFSLVACGGDNKGSGAGFTGEIENPWWTTNDDLELDSNGNVVYEEVEIDLTTVVTGADLSVLTTLIQQFNKEYNGKINVIINSIGEDSFEDSVSKQISQNDNAPDLIMSHQKGHMSFAVNKLIQPLNEAVTKSNVEINMADYAQLLSDYTDLGYEGYTFGVPVDAQSQVVYYNKQLLQEYNNGVLPQTRQELLDLCAKVKAGESFAPIAWSTSISFFQRYTFTTAVLQNGATLFNDDFKVDWYSNEANRTSIENGIKSIRELVTKGYADYDIADSSASNKFVENRALFYIGLPWNANSLFSAYGSKNGGLTNDVVMAEYVGATSLSGWFALDESAECSNLIFGDSHFFAMSNTVKSLTKKCAILEFVKWFTQTPEVGAAWAEAGHMTASTLVASSDAYVSNSFVTNYINNFYPNIDYFVAVGNTPYYTDTFAQFRNIFVSSKGLSNANDAKSIQTAEKAVNMKIDLYEQIK